MGDDEMASILATEQLGNQHLNNGGSNTSQEISIEEDSKFSTSTVSSDKNGNPEIKEGYEDTFGKSDMQDVELGNIHLSDDYGDEDDSMDISDCDDSVLSQLNRGTRQKCKRKKVPELSNLHYKCEWKNCTYEINEDSKFHLHVSYHIPDLEIKTLGNGEEVYVCLWAGCSYLTGGVKEIQRHVTFHSYHTKLKNIGKVIVKEWNLPKCTYGNETKNVIPEKIDPMVCEWEDCGKEFNNVQVFLYHIHMHVNDCFFDAKSKKQEMRCQWNACTLTSGLPTRVRLLDHMRTHTKERAVACPVCGHMFSTNTKLNDHCCRQLPNELSEFQCSHCYKQFPSLRLLKDHMRGHVNFYKCCYCDMTCTSRHTFSAHIRYKHLDSKPFKCSMCEYSCKTKHDLKTHLTSHDPEARFGCEEEGCEFSCRSKHTLQRHMIDEHQLSASPVYCCHLPDCQSRYKRGCYLTKHLMTKHCLRWPSGHSKFMYHRQEDGTYRLQTVRYESVKLYGENKSASSRSKNNSLKATPTPVEGSTSFKVSTIEPDSSNGLSQVFISIEDESGNTINCCTTSEVVSDKIPKNSIVIATAESTDCDTTV